MDFHDFLALPRAGKDSGRRLSFEIEESAARAP